MPKKSRYCPDKGDRYIKSAGTCMTSCKKGMYRQKTFPFFCRTPKKKYSKRCSKGFRKDKKGTCQKKKK